MRPALAIVVRRGTRADYAALARFHYCGRGPGVPVGWLAAEVEGCLAGVLVVSMPTLNARWRAQAWPGRYDGAARALAAQRLNREVRVISRVIVDPRYRGLGIAAMLVRSYLARPLTPRTEAVSTMARYCPLFEAAGMTPVVCAPAQRDAALTRALTVPAWKLAMPEVARLALRSSTRLRRELRVWARASRGTRPLAAGALAPLLRMAVRHLLAPPCAFVAELNTRGDHAARARHGAGEHADHARRTARLARPGAAPERAPAGGHRCARLAL